jgi:hypothetical protein
MKTHDDLLEEVERLRAEVAARLNEDDYDPAPIILEYDRVVAERDAYRGVVEAARTCYAVLGQMEWKRFEPHEVSAIMRLGDALDALSVASEVKEVNT